MFSEISIQHATIMQIIRFHLKVSLNFSTYIIIELYVMLHTYAICAYCAFHVNDTFSYQKIIETVRGYQLYQKKASNNNKLTITKTPTIMKRNTLIILWVSEKRRMLLSVCLLCHVSKRFLQQSFTLTLVHIRMFMYTNVICQKV